MNGERGLLVIVSGPSGAGKGTVLAHVLSELKTLRYSVSVTTRAPRVGEVDGKNYFFKSVKEFEEMLSKDMFLESQCVYGNYYGTPREYVENLRDNGYDVLLEIDVKGAMQVKSKVSDAVLIFLTPENTDILKARLKGRATETEEQLNTRIAASMAELNKIGSYEYVVVNDKPDRCADDVIAIIRAEKCKVRNNSVFINNLLKGDN